MKMPSLIVSLLLLGACGCQSTNMLTKMPKMPWQKNTEAEAGQKTTEEVSSAGIPQQMICVWKDGTLEANGKRIRGLAGRVYFRDAEETPVKVDGTFTVYAYPSDGILGPTKVHPERKFVFDQESLDRHFSESDLGASYSFWLPWDEVGGDEMSLTLLPIMKTSGGRIVRGEESAAILPGRKRNTIDSDIRELRQQIDQQTKQVVYESNDYDRHVQRQQLMRTDTIRVPDDAEAILQAMHTQQQTSEKASAIATTVSPENDRIRTAEANMSQSKTAKRLPDNSDEAWEQALDSFRSRGAAHNHRLDPRNIQRF